MADHHIQGDVVVEAHGRIGGGEGHQGEQAFGAELAIFRSPDAAEQVFHLDGEVSLSRCFFQQQSTGETVASFQLVANHQASAVVEE